MQGFDSSAPDPRETEIIELCRTLLPNHDIKASSLADFLELVRKEVKKPYRIEGESRDPGATGKWTHLFGDVISARTRIKRANARNETNLQRWAEPWSAIGAMAGEPYMKAPLAHAWKLLLQNHPHDTICGAGVDQMEKDVIHRADQIDLIAEGVARRGMGAVQARIDNSGLSDKDAVLTVFNPSPFPRKGVVSCLVDLPDKTGYENFSVQTPEGGRLRVQYAERFPFGTLVRNLQDISLELRSERVRCHIETGDIPALGYRTYHLVREERLPYEPGTLAPERNVLENEYLRVTFNPDGTLDLLHKATRQTYAGLHYLEDTGETGHSWVHMEPDDNQTITSHGFPVSIAIEESGPLLARVRLDYHMRIPEGLRDTMDATFREPVDNHTGRSDRYRDMVVTSRFTLRAGSPMLEVTTSMDNQCRNHRLRIVFPTRLNTDATYSEAAFDVIQRDIHVKEGSPYFGKSNPQYPMHRFVEMTDGSAGFAVLNTGIREYEAMDTAERPLAITLLRAFTFRQSPVIDRWEVYPEMELSQCLGHHAWTYALFPHARDWSNGVFEAAETLTLPLEIAQAGAHAGTLPKHQSFLEVKGGNVQMTAFKRAEDRDDSFVLRLFNPEDRGTTATISCFKDIRRAWLTNLDEERQEALSPSGNSIKLKVAKKKIVTIEFQL